MTRQERAKQFAPFDAMKGLQEALRDREERHTRVQRHSVSEEQQMENSKVLSCLDKGMRVLVNHWWSFHDITEAGIVREVNIPFRYIRLGEKKIRFEDIYDIMITDVPAEFGGWL